MGKLKYEILSPIRLGDGELVPVGAVKSLEKNDEDTQTFLRRDVIRLVPGQDDNASDDEESGGGTPGGTHGGTSDEATNETPDTPTDKTLSELLGDDLASTLGAGGYESVEQVRAATDEDLDAVEGVGPKTIERIREALSSEADEGGADQGE